MSGTSLIPPTVLLRNFDLPHDRDGVEQLTHLICLHNRCNANLSAELWTFDEQRRVIGNDLIDDEPVE